MRRTFRSVASVALVGALFAVACGRPATPPGATAGLSVDASPRAAPVSSASSAAAAPPPIANAPAAGAAPAPAAPPAPEPAPAPPSPPYDLAADRASILRRAAEELGAEPWSAVVDDVFVLLVPRANRGTLRASEKLVRQAVTAYLHERFDRGPTRAIAVYLFPSAAPYENYCRTVLHEKCISPFGFYMGDGRMIMNAGPGLGTLTHELVHPFVDADFPRAPIWINEGIASLFEAPVIPRPGEIHGVKNWRHPRLLRALSSAKGREAARLDRLFAMSDDAFRDEDEDLHYALARYVCQWLDERKQLWPFYRRWRDTVEQDPTGSKAFTDTVGMTPADANVAWTKWARDL